MMMMMADTICCRMNECVRNTQCCVLRGLCRSTWCSAFPLALPSTRCTWSTRCTCSSSSPSSVTPTAPSTRSCTRLRTTHSRPPLPTRLAASPLHGRRIHETAAAVAASQGAMQEPQQDELPGTRCRLSLSFPTARAAKIAAVRYS